MKEHHFGIAIILLIIAIGIFGGSKNMKNNNGFFSFATTTQNSDQSVNQTNEQKIADTKSKIDDIQKQIQAIEDAKTQSVYKGIVSIQYVNRSTDPNYEYVVINVSSNATTTIPITGWQLKSLSTGNSVTIPKGTMLYFTGTTNLEDPILVYPGDTVNISSGVSPNGYNFRINKCSGYLSQFQTYIPYISTNCPAPRDEDLSSIPNRVENDACFDYINSFSSCRIQIDPLPNNWSYECKKFILDKINYPSCVSTHKDDKDFYLKEWRVYLKRSTPLWKNRREEVVLYDNDGKIVSDLKY